MAIVFTCPRCDRKYSVTETMAGRRVTCKGCGQEFPVPAGSAPNHSPAWDDDDGGEMAMAPPPRTSAYQAVQMPSRIKPEPELERPRTKKRQRTGSSDRERGKSDYFGTLSGIALIGIVLSFVFSIGKKAGAVPAETAVFAALGLLIVFLVVMIISWILLVGVAQSEDGIIAALACMFVPFVMLVYVIFRWDSTRKSAISYLSGVLGMVVLLIIIPPMRPAGRNQPGAVAGGGQGRFGLPFPGNGKDLAANQNDEPKWQIGEGVVILASGIDDDAMTELVSEKLKALADPGAGGRVGVMMLGTGRPGEWKIQVEPVNDPEAFAQRIDCGTVTKKDGRKIYLTANLPADELEERRKLITFRKGQEARQKTERGQQPPPQMANQDAESPFREVKTVKPNASPTEKALNDLKSSDIFKARDALKTLVALKATDAVPAIIETLDTTFVGRDAAIALGNLGDIRAAQPLADRLEKNWPDAQKALIALGPDAEPSVLPKLFDKAPRTRTLACEVLAEIGGKETLKIMKSLPADSDFGVRIAASETMKKIAERTKGR
jgi:hypothetical protein